jgi:hypothetical protein
VSRNPSKKRLNVVVLLPCKSLLLLKQINLNFNFTLFFNQLLKIKMKRLTRVCITVIRVCFNMLQ